MRFPVLGLPGIINPKAKSKNIEDSGNSTSAVVISDHGKIEDSGKVEQDNSLDANVNSGGVLEKPNSGADGVTVDCANMLLMEALAKSADIVLAAKQL